MYNQKPLLGTLPNYAHPLTPTAAWIMNEGSGNKIYDIVGGNHGTSGAGAAAPSWKSEGLDFDGGDYINFGDKDKLIGDNHTYIFSINNRDNNEGTLFSKDVSGWEFAIFVSGTDHLEFYTADAGSIFNIDNFFPHNERVTCAISIINGTARAYKNGNYQAQGSFSVSPNNADFIIGKSRGVHWYWEGLMEYAFVYDVGLLPSQISQLYYNSYCWLTQPMRAELMYAAPPVGAIINQFQKANLCADLYDGVLIT